MKLRLALFVVLVTAFLIGCSSQLPVVQQQSDNVGDVEGLGQDLTGLDSLDEDLDTSDLDGLEDDLNVDF